MGVQYYVSYVSTHTHINELGELWSDRPLSDIVVVGFKQPCPQDTFDLGPFASAAYGSNDVTLLSGWKRIKVHYIIHLMKSVHIKQACCFVYVHFFS